METLANGNIQGLANHTVVIARDGSEHTIADSCAPIRDRDGSGDRRRAGVSSKPPPPGYAVFKLRGHEFTLHPILEEPGAKELFYIFRDETSGKETYPAGRFFYSDMPKGGKVILDFNKAYNPPCAFTPYATCPLPPPENRLAVRIEAGEKRYGH